MILGGATYTVTRHEAGAWANGFYTEGASSTWTLWASLQPLDDRTLELLPEAARSEARWWFAFDEGDLEVGDRVTVGAAEYLVLHLADWRGHTPLPYRAAVLGEVTAS